MFGLGFSEIILIMAIALIFLGPDHLPEFARTLGKNVGQLKKILDDLKSELNTSIQDIDKEPTKKIEESKKEISEEKHSNNGE